MRKILIILIAFTFLSFSFTPLSAVDLSLIGPGGRLHGADISRWQHPDDKLIDFQKMHDAGLGFVMIKASDTRYDSDQLAIKWLKKDREGAQAAGIYTGFYHYAILPNVTQSNAIIRDAKVQAQKVLWRIASVGGYNEMDLPIALDLEDNCVKANRYKICSKRASRKAATLWAKTFLRTILDKTGRTPFIYSSPHFLETALIRDKELSSYPLWIAQYAINPAKDGARPNVKPGGCFVHSWTTSECSARWVVWQYTSCGIAPKYGVPGNRLDLNVFAGGIEKFNSLLTGSWQPDSQDAMPSNETTTMTITSISTSTTDKNTIINVEVMRPDATPVVTGTVHYYFTAENLTKPKVIQTAARQTSGVWKLMIEGLPAGSWSGYVGFKDQSGTHAEVQTPLNLEIAQGSNPSPKPLKKPPPRPVIDTCRKQIKN